MSVIYKKSLIAITFFEKDLVIPISFDIFAVKNR